MNGIKYLSSTIEEETFLCKVAPLKNTAFIGPLKEVGEPVSETIPIFSLK